jgi:tetratricopeptide (TPR) repeat protein
MNNKVSSVLEKAHQDKAKGNYQKALRRLTEALAKHPDEVELYLEAADVCLEGGESLQATQHLRKAHSKFGMHKDRVDTFCREKLRTLGDPVLGKYLLENAIRRRDPDWASEMLDDLQDRTIRELLQRSRTKKRTLKTEESGGHSLKSEIVLNVMSEALLCLRLGRIKESMRSFLEILDDKPVENEVLEPFFRGLEKKFPKSGRIRFAYGCSLIYAQQYEKASARLVQGVKMEPKIGEEALERLRDLSESFEKPPESLQSALVEILLAQGDVLRAGEILKETLADNPEKAKWVIELLQPYVVEISESLMLHYLLMDAALVADQTNRVLETLKRICQSDSHKDDAFRWLENKSSEQFLPADVMLLHGEMALEAGDFARTVEIFKAIASSSPGDLPAVLNVLKKHKDGDPRLAEFYEEQAAKQKSATPRSDEGDGFEHFENKEFKFSSGTTQEIEIKTEEPAEASSETSDDRKTDEPKVVPVELDEGPFAGDRNVLGDHDEAEAPLADEPGKALEQGLGRAARGAGRGGSPEIVWEEEGADGVADPTDQPAVADQDQAWLETQSDSIIDRESGGESRTVEEQQPVKEGEKRTASSAADPQPSRRAREDEEVSGAAREAPDGIRAATVLSDAPGETEGAGDDRDAQPETSESQPAPETAEEAEAPDESTFEIDEKHVKSLAEALRVAGARLFFHVDEGTEPQAQDDTKTAGDIPKSAVEPTGAPAAGPAELPKAAADEETEVEHDDDDGAIAPKSMDDEVVEAETEADAQADVEAPKGFPQPSGEREEEAEEEILQDAAPDDTPHMVPTEDDAGADGKTGTPTDPFDARFDQFLDGRLDNGNILALVEEALESGRMEEARELLHFEPQDEAQEIARNLHLVHYHLAVDRPAHGLALIEAVDLSALAPEDRRDMLIGKAACHKRMNDYENADKIYTEIMKEFPSSDVERIAERNHERYLRAKRGGALVLEKTTSLSDD